MIVGDYVLLTDKVLGENLKLIQQQYQDVSKELKQIGLDAVQLNKKLPISIINRIDNVIDQQLIKKKSVNKVEQQPKPKVAAKVSSAHNLKTDTQVDISIDTDAKFSLLLFF